MNVCAGMDGLLAERASGPIAPEDEARVAEHLAACPGCRAEADAYQGVLGLVRNSRGATAAPLRPFHAQGERAADAGSLAGVTLRAWKQRRQRRVAALALGAGFGAAAAAAVLVLAPAFMAARAPRGEGATADVAALASWEPDVDAALYDAGQAGDAVEVASAAADEVTAEDVVLAAYDEADAL